MADGKTSDHIQEPDDQQGKDTQPISPANNTDVETTPLNTRSYKGVKDKLSKVGDITGDLSQPKKDSYSRFKNEVEEVNECDLHDVEIDFQTGDTSSNWSLDTSNASTSATVVKWYKHPKVREHWKVVVISFILFFIGLGLCITGIILESLNVNLSAIYIFFVVGTVCFIPGVYHLIAVYCAVKGKRGFSFYNLPLFN